MLVNLRLKELGHAESVECSECCRRCGVSVAAERKHQLVCISRQTVVHSANQKNLRLSRSHSICQRHLNCTKSDKAKPQPTKTATKKKHQQHEIRTSSLTLHSTNFPSSSLHSEIFRKTTLDDAPKIQAQNMPTNELTTPWTMMVVNWKQSWNV